MKRALLLFFLAAAALCGQPATLDFGPRGQLTLYFPDGWKTAVEERTGETTLVVKPTTDANATCTVTVTFPERDEFDTKARLKLRVEADGLPIAENSVERKAVAREFMLSSGFGYYCSFTDADLRSQPPLKGEYKVTSIGRIRLAPGVYAHVQILADDFRGPAYQELLGAVEGMEFRAGR